MRSARILLPFVTLVALALSACSNADSGTPEAAGDPDSSVTSSGTTNPPSTGSDPSGASPLSGANPCSFLTTAEVEKHGDVEKNSPQHKTIGTADVCSWPGDAGDSAALVPTTSIAVRENAGVQDVTDKGKGVQQTEENGRKYARSPGPGGCTIAIGVTNSSRVDVTVSGTESSDQACQIANALTEVAEPNVPRS